MANTYIPLAQYELSSTQSTITFSSIPNSYTDLILLATMRSNNASEAEGVSFRYNGDTGANYTVSMFGGVDTGTFADRNNTGTAGNTRNSTVPAANSTASVFNHFELYIAGYANTSNKKISGFYHVWKGSASSTGTGGMGSIYWNSTSAITSITIYLPNGTSFVADSCFYLYGIS